jgi:hypothetical protein
VSQTPLHFCTPCLSKPPNLLSAPLVDRLLSPSSKSKSKKQRQSGEEEAKLLAELDSAKELIEHNKRAQFIEFDQASLIFLPHDKVKDCIEQRELELELYTAIVVDGEEYRSCGHTAKARINLHDLLKPGQNHFKFKTTVIYSVVKSEATAAQPTLPPATTTQNGFHSIADTLPQFFHSSVSVAPTASESTLLTCLFSLSLPLIASVDLSSVQPDSNTIAPARARHRKAANSLAQQLSINLQPLLVRLLAEYQQSNQSAMEFIGSLQHSSLVKQFAGKLKKSMSSANLSDHREQAMFFNELLAITNNILSSNTSTRQPNLAFTPYNAEEGISRVKQLFSPSPHSLSQILFHHTHYPSKPPAATELASLADYEGYRSALASAALESEGFNEFNLTQQLLLHRLSQEYLNDHAARSAEEEAAELLSISNCWLDLALFYCRRDLHQAAYQAAIQAITVYAKNYTAWQYTAILILHSLLSNHSEASPLNSLYSNSQLFFIFSSALLTQPQHFPSGILKLFTNTSIALSSADEGQKPQQQQQYCDWRDLLSIIDLISSTRCFLALDYFLEHSAVAVPLLSFPLPAELLTIGAYYSEQLSLATEEERKAKEAVELAQSEAANRKVKKKSSSHSSSSMIASPRTPGLHKKQLEQELQALETDLSMAEKKSQELQHLAQQPTIANQQSILYNYTQALLAEHHQRFSDATKLFSSVIQLIQSLAAASPSEQQHLKELSLLSSLHSARCSIQLKDVSTALHIYSSLYYRDSNISPLHCSFEWQEGLSNCLSILLQQQKWQLVSEVLLTSLSNSSFKPPSLLSWLILTYINVQRKEYGQAYYSLSQCQQFLSLHYNVFECEINLLSTVISVSLQRYDSSVQSLNRAVELSRGEGQNSELWRLAHTAYSSANMSECVELCAQYFIQ